MCERGRFPFFVLPGNKSINCFRVEAFVYTNESISVRTKKVPCSKAPPARPPLPYLPVVGGPGKTEPREWGQILGLRLRSVGQKVWKEGESGWGLRGIRL